MSEPSAPAHDPTLDHHRARARASPQTVPPDGLPAVPVPPTASGILHDPRLTGRGNGIVRQTVLQRIQRTQGNRAAQRVLGRPLASRPAVVIQRMKAEVAQALYKRANQQTNSLQKAKAIQQVRELKQQGGSEWADYCRHNNLTAEGLPPGMLSLGSFGKQQEAKQQHKQEKEQGKEQAVTTTTDIPSVSWAQFYQSGSVTLAQYLTPASKQRLARKYGDTTKVYTQTLEARGEQDILQVAQSIFNLDARSVYKGDIGEVLAASAKQAAGWVTTTHQFDSTEPGLDVVAFAPEDYHIVITEVKYWPSGLGRFEFTSLPIAYQAAMTKQNASVIKQELIELLKQRGELKDVFERYMGALHGAHDVYISWEIEIIGDTSTEIAKEVQALAEQGIVTIAKHGSVTARLTIKAPSPKATPQQETPLHKLSAPSKPVEEVPKLETVADPYADGQFQATYTQLQKMPQTPTIQGILQTMTQMLQGHEEGSSEEDDEPYWYYGRIKW